MGDGFRPVAEAIAASVCWLARFRHGDLAAVTDGVSYWHRQACRFCAVTDMDELLDLADLAKCDPDELRWWDHAPRKARAAKVYEAQEEPWWTKLP